MLYTMLFARYPFERPEDKKLDQHQRLQRILHRIIKASGAATPAAQRADPPAASEVTPARSRRRCSAARRAVVAKGRQLYARPGLAWPGAPAKAAWHLRAVLTRLTPHTHPNQPPPSPSQVDYVVPDSPAITPACRDLLQKILVADPAKRLNIAQIFQHPWVTQVWGWLGCGGGGGCVGVGWVGWGWMGWGVGGLEGFKGCVHRRLAPAGHARGASPQAACHGLCARPLALRHASVVRAVAECSVARDWC